MVESFWLMDSDSRPSINRINFCPSFSSSIPRNITSFGIFCLTNFSDRNCFYNQVFSIYNSSNNRSICSNIFKFFYTSSFKELAGNDIGEFNKLLKFLLNRILKTSKVFYKKYFTPLLVIMIQIKKRNTIIT